MTADDPERSFLWVSIQVATTATKVGMMYYIYVTSRSFNKPFGVDKFRKNVGGRTMRKQTELVRTFGIIIVAALCSMSFADAAPPSITIELPTPVQADTATVMGSTTSIVYTVPNGRRLAIEFLTVTGTKTANQTVVGISIKTTLDSTDVTHRIMNKLSNEFDVFGGFRESKVVQLFADENTDVIIRVSGDLGTTVDAWQATISGRLESMSTN